MPSSGAELDDVFRAFADVRRRHLLVHLVRSEDDQLCVDDATRELALANDAHPERVGTALRHHHLPKLEAAGLIDHDPDDGTIEYLGHEIADGILETIEPDPSYLAGESADPEHFG